MDAKGRVLSDESIAGEVPFELPEGWCWARLDSLAAAIVDGDHQAPPQQSAGIPFLVISNISNGMLDFHSTRFVGEDYFKQLDYFRKPQMGDLLLTVTGSFGIAVKVNTDKRFCFQRHIALIRLIDCVDYVAMAASSPAIYSYFKEVATGTAQKTVSLGSLRSALIPLPPLAEQRRVAERVSELMPLVDRYGELEGARERLDAALPDRLRRSVLQEAVRGRLVPQDPSDEPAGMLLERIRAERRELAAEGKLKLPRGGDSIIFIGSDGRRYEKRVDARGRETEPVCIEDEIPFEIPEGWAWARLGAVAQISGGGTPDKSNPRFWNGDIPWASVKDLKGDYLAGTIDYISQKGLLSKTSISRCAPGDLIVATRLVPGKSIICSCDSTINQDLKRIRSRLDIQYLHLWFQSYRPHLHKLGQGTTVPGIKLPDLTSALIPVPPLAEQRRIVRRFTALYPFTSQ